MYYNRVDICEAWYLFLSSYHWGQGSDMYARLSRLTLRFRPSPMLRYESLSENGKQIYDLLVDTRGESYAIG